MQITSGRIVHYMLGEIDAEQINKRRRDFAKSNAKEQESGLQAHFGNPVVAGEIYPMIVTRVWINDMGVNGQVLLDGNDTYWATSVHEGTGRGDWSWPERVG